MRTPKSAPLLFIVLLFIAAGSCKKSDCVQSAGARVATIRNVGSFHGISLYDNMHLVLKQDTAEAVVVEAGENLQPNIGVTVEKGILTLRNNTSCRWLRTPSETVTVRVSVKMLDELNYNGSGNVSSENTLKAQTITFNSTEGAGNVDISLDAERTFTNIMDENATFIFHGRSNECQAFTSSRGIIDFSGFEVKHMVFRYAGIRDATIYTPNYLDVILYHTGNVYYTGTPGRIITKYHSSGRLLPMN